MSLENKTIVVTGGTGLLGKALIPILLERGARVVCLTRREIKSDHRNLTYIHCDLCRQQDISSIRSRLKKIDILMYLAASIPQLHEKKETIFDAKRNTLDPFTNFLEAIADITDKTIFSGTIDIYGYPKNTEFDENSPINPETPYALAKHTCEEYLRFFSKVNNKPYVIVRFAQIYGPNEPYVRVIPFIIQAALTNKPFTLWGNSGNKRRFIYVKDAVLALIKAAQHTENDIFHIAGKEIITIADAIETIQTLTGKQIKIEYKSPDAEPVHIVPSIKKAENVLKFTPKFSFEEGMKEVISNV